MHHVLDLGIGKVAKELLEWSEDSPIHMSFDIDSIDPTFAPASGTLARGGLTDREAHFLL